MVGPTEAYRWIYCIIGIRKATMLYLIIYISKKKKIYSSGAQYKVGLQPHCLWVSIIAEIYFLYHSLADDFAAFWEEGR